MWVRRAGAVDYTNQSHNKLLSTTEWMRNLIAIPVGFTTLYVGSWVRYEQQLLQRVPRTRLLTIPSWIIQCISQAWKHLSNLGSNCPDWGRSESADHAAGKALAHPCHCLGCWAPGGLVQRLSGCCEVHPDSGRQRKQELELHGGQHSLGCSQHQCVHIHPWAKRAGEQWVPT